LAKKAATLRVHQLAKELGVVSKEIVAKCVAEDVPGIKDHNSAVSIGLAETIREWFGAIAAQNAIETADPVAVEPVRQVASRRPARAAAKSGDSAEVNGRGQDAAGGGGDSGESSTAVADRPDSSTRQRAAAAASSPAAPADADVKSDAQSKAASETGSETGGATSTAAKAGGPRVVRAQAGAPASTAAAAADVKATEARPERAAADSRTAASPNDRAGSAGDAGAKSDARSDRPIHAGQSGTAIEADTGTDQPTDSTKTDSRSDETLRPAAAAASADDGDSPVMNIPERPKDVKAAGPMLNRPTKATLSGPRVIRVEAADPVPAPRSMRSGPSYGRGDAGPMRGGAGAGPAGRGVGGGAGAGAGARRTDRRRGGDGATGRTGRAFGDNETRFEPWREQDVMEREQRLNRSRGFIKAHRRDLKKGGPANRPQVSRPEGPIKVEAPMTVKSLSAATGVKGVEILKRLLLSGTMSTINSAIEPEQAVEIMLEIGLEIEIVQERSAVEVVSDKFENREIVDLRPRAPVVTILGHVDHGKTSLLDRIRNANVAEGEAGGITQATSAFQVPVKAGDRDRMVTFIDTPGHEAFTGMRARGAQVTDVVVLVVAADDGVMPQTIESINHAKAAGVPMVVALNKIDKAEATEGNITRILGQLAEHEMNPAEWGGSTEVIRTSAERGDGIQDLLDILDYQADLLDLKADFGGLARGTVLEAALVEGRGPVARIIVQEGTLRRGDFINVGRAFGRVRDMVNDRGQRIDEAGPSTPVAISGIDVLPDAGDKLYECESLRAAEEAADERRASDRERELSVPRVTLDNIFDRMKAGQKKELALVVKADVHGSLETLNALLAKMSDDEVHVAVKHSAVGGVNESDISLAEATGAIIVGFNVTSSSKARQLADERGVEIRLYDVIYDITDDVAKAMVGLLEPELRLEVLGHAEVRQVFRVSKVGMIAGCYVTDGVIERNSQIRVTRDGIVVEKDRRLEQLKRFKDDAKEVRSGTECGMKINGYDDIKVGDVLECYRTVSVARGS